MLNDRDALVFWNEKQLYSQLCSTYRMLTSFVATFDRFDLVGPVGAVMRATSLFKFSTDLSQATLLPMCPQNERVRILFQTATTSGFVRARRHAYVTAISCRTSSRTASSSYSIASVVRAPTSTHVPDPPLPDALRARLSFITNTADELPETTK